jgi:hypothetical protein
MEIIKIELELELVPLAGEVSLLLTTLRVKNTVAKALEESEPLT